MASIQPIAASLTAVRPAATSKTPRVTPQIKTTTDFVPPLRGQAALGQGRRIGVLDEAVVPPTTSGVTAGTVAPGGAGSASTTSEQAVADPIDLSGVEERTRVVIAHTVGALHDRTAMSHEDIVNAVAEMFKDLLVADGVANPEAAAKALAEEAMDALEADDDTDSEPLEPEAVKAGGTASGGLDLEG